MKIISLMAGVHGECKNYCPLQPLNKDEGLIVGCFARGVTKDWDGCFIINMSDEGLARRFEGIPNKEKMVIFI